MNDIFWHFQLNSDTMSIVRGVQLFHLMLGDDISILNRNNRNIGSRLGFCRSR